MSKQTVAEYVMHTVENTNPAMLNGLLDQLVVESGEDAVEAATPDIEAAAVLAATPYIEAAAVLAATPDIEAAAIVTAADIEETETYAVAGDVAVTGANKVAFIFDEETGAFVKVIGA